MKLKRKRLPRLSTKPTGIASKQRRCCRSATRLSYTKSANTVSRRARAITSFRRALRAEVRAGVVDPRPASPLAEAPTPQRTSLTRSLVRKIKQFSTVAAVIGEVAIDCFGMLQSSVPREARVAGDNHEARASLYSGSSWHDAARIRALLQRLRLMQQTRSSRVHRRD